MLTGSISTILSGSTDLVELIGLIRLRGVSYAPPNSVARFSFVVAYVRCYNSKGLGLMLPRLIIPILKQTIQVIAMRQTRTTPTIIGTNSPELLSFSSSLSMLAVTLLELSAISSGSLIWLFSWSS